MGTSVIFRAPQEQSADPPPSRSASDIHGGAVLRAVVLRPLPFPSADRLLMVWQTDRNAGTAREPVSVPDLLDFTERSRQIERFGAFGSYTLLGPPLRIRPFGLSFLRSATEMSGRTSSLYTPFSRTRRAMSCAYCEPKSRIGIASSWSIWNY